MRVGGIEAAEDVENEVVICGAAEDAEFDTTVVALLDGMMNAMDVDEAEITLDKGTAEEEAVLLGVICTAKAVLEIAVLLGVAVAVQCNCGSTL